MAVDAARLLYTVAEGDRGEAMVYSTGADGLVGPEELSAELLAHLVRLAEGALHQRVEGAVRGGPRAAGTGGRRSCFPLDTAEGRHLLLHRLPAKTLCSILPSPPV